MKNKLLLLASLVVTFCANAQKKKRAEKISNENLGYVVGSVTLENTRKITSNYFLYYSNDSLDALYEENAKKLIGGIRKRNRIYCTDIDIYNRPFDFKVGKSFVYLFRIEKPVGNYRFTELALFRNTGYMQSTVYLTLEIPFVIEKDKSNYIGDFVLNEKGLELKLENNFSRDSASFHKKYPQFNLSNAQ